MKKMYNQPIVEAAEVQATSLMQAASPAQGITGGGNTSNLGGNDPIEGD